MPGIIVKPRSRIFHGHDWVYSSEVRKFFGDPQPGEVITLKDYRDRPLGSAIFNPQAQVVARRISRRKQGLDIEFFSRRISQAIALRSTSKDINPELCRLVWSDSDALPGVIIDRYKEHLVLQIQTLAMLQHIPLITEVLITLLSPESITLKNDSIHLAAEGIEKEFKTLHGSPPKSLTVSNNGIDFEIDFTKDSSSMLQLDQLKTHEAVAKYAKGKRVLSAFGGHGEFAIACAKAGASNVTSIEISEQAISATQKNASLNKVTVNSILHNAFDYIKHCEESFDLIILDPPSFTRNKKSLQDAMKAYKEIHLRSLKLLEKDGILSTHCSSHYATTDIFLDNIVSASVDTKRTLRLIESHGQSLDHPALPALPETNYLKGFSLQLTPSR